MCYDFALTSITTTADAISTCMQACMAFALSTPPPPLASRLGITVEDLALAQ